jgi:signal transduction histidine kinase
MKGNLFHRLTQDNVKARGKGFGLYLIKMLVDDFGGKFWIEDRVPGDYTKGAKFVVMLPAVDM